jgi:hypothetical protein
MHTLCAFLFSCFDSLYGQCSDKRSKLESPTRAGESPRRTRLGAPSDLRSDEPRLTSFGETPGDSLRSSPEPWLASLAKTSLRSSVAFAPCGGEQTFGLRASGDERSESPGACVVRRRTRFARPSSLASLTFVRSARRRRRPGGRASPGHPARGGTKSLVTRAPTSDRMGASGMGTSGRERAEGFPSNLCNDCCPDCLSAHHRSKDT